MRSLFIVTALILLVSCGQSQTDQRAPATIPRLHCYAGIGFASSRATSNYVAFLKGQGYYIDDYSSLFESRRSYGHGSGTSLQVDYAVSDRVRLGAAISTIGRLLGGEAFAGGASYGFPGSYASSFETVLRAATIGYYAVGSYMFVRHKEERGLDVMAGFGLGLNSIRVEYGSQIEYYSYSTVKDIPANGGYDKQTLGTLVFLLADFWSSASLSIGFNLTYRYIPAQTLDAVSYNVGTYMDYTSSPPVMRTVVATLPAAEISFSNVLYGIMIGYHF